MPLFGSVRRAASGVYSIVMKQEKEARISYWAAHLTTIVSVALVLVIIGAIALISLGAASETRRLKEKLELNAVMTDSATDARADSLAAVIAAKPYTLKARAISREEAIKQWKADTGEDLQALFGVNPLSPEVSFTLRAEYASPEQISRIKAEVGRMAEVQGVAAPDTAMVKAMNDNIATAAYVLGCIALVLMVISFVLINNTVHLTIYSRRFTIHTMQLVGATGGFIRRPIVGNNLLSGVIAGLVASAILAVAMVGAPELGFGYIEDLVPWWQYGCVAAALVAIGAVICSIAAVIATNRYLRKDYDELFR